MKDLVEQDFYELLEAAPDSTEEELRKALLRARRTWCDEVGAAYSLLDDDERANMTARLDKAELLLFDPVRRAAYNEELSLAAPPQNPRNGQGPRLVLPSRDEHDEEAQPALFPRPAAVRDSNESQSGGAKVLGFARPSGHSVPEVPPAPKPAQAEPEPQASAPAEPKGTESVAECPDPAGFFHSTDDYTGENLRKYREECGRSLKEIARETKVSRTHLENMEAEEYSLLPAAVYVRGFLQGYCRELGLDSGAVCEGYLARLQRSRGQGS